MCSWSLGRGAGQESILTCFSIHWEKVASYFDVKIERCHFTSQWVALCDCSLLHHLYPAPAGAPPAPMAQQDVIPDNVMGSTICPEWLTRCGASGNQITKGNFLQEFGELSKHNLASDGDLLLQGQTWRSLTAPGMVSWVQGTTRKSSQEKKRWGWK